MELWLEKSPLVISGETEPASYSKHRHHLLVMKGLIKADGTLRVIALLFLFFFFFSVFKSIRKLLFGLYPKHTQFICNDP